jgi:hypothetical protein
MEEDMNGRAPQTDWMIAAAVGTLLATPEAGSATLPTPDGATYPQTTTRPVDSPTLSQFDDLCGGLTATEPAFGSREVIHTDTDTAPRSAAGPAPTRRRWHTAPIIAGLVAGLMATGCAARDPATADTHTTQTRPASCPPGTHRHTDECLNNSTATPTSRPPRSVAACPPGTHLRAGECLNNIRNTTAGDQ